VACNIGSGGQGGLCCELLGYPASCMPRKLMQPGPATRPKISRWHRALWWLAAGAPVHHMTSGWTVAGLAGSNRVCLSRPGLVGCYSITYRFSSTQVFCAGPGLHTCCSVQCTAPRQPKQPRLVWSTSLSCCAELRACQPLCTTLYGAARKWVTQMGVSRGVHRMRC
jgi:hypothetical protein